IHAISKSGRLRSILENMTEMSAAAATVNLRSRHPKSPIGPGGDPIGKGLPKAGPPGVALELGLRRKQRQIAAGTSECSGALLFIERAGVRPLRSLLSQHGILLARQEFPPFGVRVCHFETLRCPSRGPRRHRAIDADKCDDGGAAKKDMST